MSELSAWLDEATPERREVPVCFDRRLLSDLAKAKEALLEDTEPANEPTLGGVSATSEARERVAELTEQIRAKTRIFVFEGLGWGPWRALMAKHPPAPDQAETFARAVQLAFMPHAVENIGYDAETFVPAAIAASCVEPGITEAEARRLLDSAPPGVLERIWTAVLEVNLAGGSDPFAGMASVGNSDAARPSTRK
jgi:hypothetical protein